MDTAFVHISATGQVRDPLDKAAGEAASGCQRDELREARVQAQLDRLAELADMGLELARGLVRRAARLETEEGPGYEAACLAFTRINRAIRQINAQEQEILGLREQSRREERRARVEAGEKAAAERKAAGRREVFTTVRGLLEADSDLDHGEIDDLHRRLDQDYDDLDDLYQGSHEEIVARICRDMGVAENGEPPEDVIEETASADGGASAAAEPPTPEETHRRIYAALARLKGTGPP